MTILNVTREVAALRRMPTRDLVARYAELFGEATATRNRPWLVKKIAWRLQELAHGGLSERARRKAEELAHDADLRVVPPKGVDPLAVAEPAPTILFRPDNRLPPPGTVITRDYKGQTLRVTVMPDGFLY
jgi:hypothetical protein